MNFFDRLMAPLGKDYCALFYYLALFAVIGFVMGFFQKKSRYAMGAYFMSFISNILMYYFLRIYYSMCIASLR